MASPGSASSGRGLRTAVCLALTAALLLAVPDTAARPADATVTITDNDDAPVPPPTVTVSFGAPTYTVPEGGTISVTVLLSDAPGREVLIPLTETPGGGATRDDYYGVLSRLIYSPTQTSWLFTFTATNDTDDDDDGKTVTLGFGTLPPGVAAGTYPTATITITDNDDAPVPPPTVTVSFGAPTYTVPEGGTISVTVLLSDAPGREVLIPLTETPGGGATRDDYYGVLSRLIYSPTQTSWLFTFTATNDTDDDDDGKTVTLGFGTLPPGVAAGTYPTATITITDNDDAPVPPPTVTVSFGAPTYTVPEGGTISVTVLLSDAPGREVLIPLTETPGGGATRDDYYGVLSRLIYSPTQTSWLFTFTATNDTDDDDGKTVTLGFGTLPPGVAAGTYPTATITITSNGTSFVGRPPGGDRDAHHADVPRGFGRHVHRGADVKADRAGDSDPDGGGRPGRDGGQTVIDVHGAQLAHPPDGDGARGRRRRHDQRLGNDRTRSERRELRIGARQRRGRDGDRRQSRPAAVRPTNVVTAAPTMFADEFSEQAADSATMMRSSSPVAVDRPELKGS